MRFSLQGTTKGSLWYKVYNVQEREYKREYKRPEIIKAVKE